MSISLETQNHRSKSIQFFHAPVCNDCSRKLFAFCVLFIVCVSIYDTYLVLAYPNGILVGERNPICLYLIRQDASQFSWFIAGKVLGNVMVVSTLLGLYFSGFRHALTVAKGVALFQLSLLIFLHFSDRRTGFLHFDDIGSNDPSKFYWAMWSLLLHVLVIGTVIVGGVCAKRKWR